MGELFPCCLFTFIKLARYLLLRLKQNEFTMKRIFNIVTILSIILVSCQKAPTAKFHLDSDYIVVGQDVIFHNDSQNGDSYDWDFGDGFTSSEREPIHSFSTNGTFDVILTVTSANGKEDKSSMSVVVVIPTLLMVEVREYTEDYVVPNASVLLYKSLADWNEGNVNKSLIEGITDMYGVTVFADLDPFVYYVDVWEKDHDNYLLASEDVRYIRTPQVMPHQINYFLALVDKANHAKGVRSDKLVVKKFIRNPNERELVKQLGTDGWKELYARAIKVTK
jgi:hypothetical protein